MRIHPQIVVEVQEHALSRQNRIDDMPVHISQATVDTIMAISQPSVVNAQ